MVLELPVTLRAALAAGAKSKRIKVLVAGHYPVSLRIAVMNRDTSSPTNRYEKYALPVLVITPLWEFHSGDTGMTFAE